VSAGAPDHLDRIRAQWRRERPDLDTAPIELVGRLLRTAHLTDAALAARLAPFGLQTGWFDLLAALRRSGEPFELNPTRLMDETMLSSGGVTKRLDRMAEAGLVERRPDPDDRRGTLVGLTTAGKDAIDRAVEAHVANEEQLLGALGPGDRRALDDALRKLLTDLEASDGP
jgi:DNA-binding MarR family transcriptional regulator